MKHNISLEGFGVRLRPATLEDSAFIVELRNSPHAIGLIGDSAQTVETQRAWLQRHFEVPDDYYFVIETSHDNRAVGVLGIYDIHGDVGEWGRWIIKPGVPAAAASAWLVLKICFEQLGLKTVRGLIVEMNKEVISFHRRIGYELIGVHPQPRIIGNRPVHMIEFRTTRDAWPKLSAALERYARMSQTLLGTCRD
jgi:RimJ/RimL family protein N-acetyltransferase